MAHNHHHHLTKNIGITVILNLTITIGQVVGGIISGSISLLSDALHNFSDVLALIISWGAVKLGFKKSNKKYTFGFKRAETFAAFVNSFTLIFIAIFLIIEAVKRFISPVDVKGNIIIYLAVFSILANGLSVLLIKKDATESMNIKSAYLHLFTDMLTSIAVLIGGLMIKFFNIFWIDPAISLLIAVYLIFNSWTIFVSAIKIFMEFSPEDININSIIEEIEKLPELKNLHHVHLWQLDEHEILLECHVDLRDDIRISEFDFIQQKINMILEKYGIHHSNIQPEWEINDNKEIISSFIH